MADTKIKVHSNQQAFVMSIGIKGEIRNKKKEKKT